MKNIALFLAVLFFPAAVFASAATTAATPNSMPTPQPVQYELPYPGILPDSPLYFLKQARDWIMDKLITDPLKKTEFYVRQADKGLNTGLFLMEKGKPSLAQQIISKEEKYMDSAFQTLISLKTRGRDVPAYMTDRMTKALAKHEEILTAEIAKATDASLKSGLTGSLELVKSLQQELPKLK